MPKFVRVRDKDTGHRFSVLESELRHGNYERLNSDAVNRNGDPLPAEFGKPKKSLSSTNTDGQKATNENKES